MDSNPTICEEKLTSNPNRKWGFIFIFFSINPHFIIYIYKII